MRRNWDLSMMVLIIILAFSSFRNGAFSSPMEWLMNKLMFLPAIIIGLSLHEYAHAKVAYKLGDPTPKMQGRVSINPLAHIDWVGFASLIFVGFGWGRPVEINPANFKNRRRDELLVSLAGVVMNLIIAVIFAFVAKILLAVLGYSFLSGTFGNILWNHGDRYRHHQSGIDDLQPDTVPAIRWILCDHRDLQSENDGTLLETVSVR